MKLSKVFTFVFLLFSSPLFAIRYGELVEAEKYPEVLYFEMSGAGKGVSFCTGVLIHPQVVLTVAHCLNEQNQDDARVYARSLDRGFFRNPQRQEIEDVVIKTVKFHSELSLVLLQEAVENIRPIKIKKNVEWVEGDEALIVGFGVTERFGHSKNRPREGYIQFSQSIKYEGGQMWKFTPGRLFSQGCQGDSGGPLYQLFQGGRKLTGVASFISNDKRSLSGLSPKEKCTRANSSYYIPLDPHRKWLNKKIQKWGLNPLRSNG